MQGSSNLYNELHGCLDELVKLYRSLLNVVRKEKDILVSANLDDLNENNRVKESLLVRIRSEESRRVQLTSDLAAAEDIDSKNPRLLDLALHFEHDERGNKLRNMHSVLELLLKRVQEFNKQNEILIEAGLSNITGAMQAIRETFQDKTTYAKKGQAAGAPTQSGQFVSREA